MDPLTHTLTGAALGEAGFRRAGRLATPTLIVAANLPDLDVFAYVAGADAALCHRRGLTHGPLGILLLSLVLAGVMACFDAWQRRRRTDLLPDRFATLTGLAYLGTLTHPLLDWLNTYGVRLLLPLDATWYHGDALFIVDPWVWLVLGGAVYTARRARGAPPRRAWAVLALLAVAVVLMGPAGGGTRGMRVLWVVGLSLVVLGGRVPRGSRQGARWAAAALVLTAVYGGFMAWLSDRVEGEVRSQLEAWGTAGRDVMAAPIPLRPLERTVLAAAPDGYRSGSYDPWRRPPLLLDRDPRQSLPIELIRDPVVARAWNDPSIRGFRNWARFPTATTRTSGDRTTVYFLDLRYTDRPTRGFGGAVVEAERARPE